MKRVMVVGARGIPNVEGGAEKNAEMIFPRIAANGYDVEVMGLASCMEPTEYKGVRRVTAPQLNFLGTDKMGYYLYAVWRAFKTRPDIVHMQGLGSALMLLLYKMTGAKTVVRYGSADYTLKKWGTLGRLGFLTAEAQMRFANGVISVAPSLSKRLAERGMEKNVEIIPNAVDFVDLNGNEEALSAPIADPYILSVGRVTHQKNFVALAKAFEAVKAEIGQQVKLVIVGGCDDSGYADELEAVCGSDIILTGRLPRDQLGAYYKNCLMFVNSSLHEGHSNAILEAISYGCPLILSDIVENRDIPLPDYQFFDPNSVEDIARVIAACAKDRSSYFVDKSSFMNWDEVASRTVALYEKAFQ